MKKVFVCLFSFTVLLCACGSSQKSTSDSSEELADSRAHKAWMMDRGSRAVGNGQHFREQAAINIAELQARATLARQMATVVKQAIREETGGDEKFAGDGGSGLSVTDQSAGSADRVEAITEEIVKDAKVIEISRFKQKNNQYNVYVCVGYMNGQAEMAEKAFQALEQVVPDNQKQKMREDRDKIIRNIKESFKK